MKIQDLKKKLHERYKKSFYAKKRTTVMKDIRNLFRLEKETKEITDRILRDIKNRFEHEEDNYYKLVKVNKFLE